jgi:LmbE family N-acetylglucosaminyl deacetylase
MKTGPPAHADRQTVVFLHAHPDDESVFSAITMRRLADRGHRVVLATATAGEVGQPRIALSDGETLAHRRLTELEAACDILGVERLVLLGHRDSGMHGTQDNLHPEAFCNVPIASAARRLADLLEEEGADTLVHYDSDGGYGHPDHVMVHRVGAAAAALTGLTAYESTIDREHLHFVETHLISDGDPPRTRPGLGRMTVEITLALQGDDHEISSKRLALLAHASQIEPVDLVPDETLFAESYGYEWYVRTSTTGTLEHLGNAHATAFVAPPRGRHVKGAPPA